MSSILTKLKLPNSPNYNFLDIYQLKEKMIDEVIKTPINSYSDTIILPYFDLEAAGSSFVTMQREIWAQTDSIRARHAELEHKRLFGGLLIPKTAISNKEARSRLLSQLIDKYRLDGIYLILEGLSGSIATVADATYLEGCKIIIKTLEKFYGEVIVSRSDIAVLPFMSNGIFATGWSKSNRHLMLDSQGRRGQYKMKWFSLPLFTFIEEQSNIETIVDYGYTNLLGCGSPCFAANEHLEPEYDPIENSEQLHYYHQINDVINNAHHLEQNAYREYYKETVIGTANSNGSELRTSTSGLIDNKIVPNYEGLIALIGD